MRRILRDKLVELVRGEEGVALVVTLAVFFFMYLIIAGIYTVGTQVRERIHLQNACDAAAYSAAVVQADTLARIATINRAMSWTYVQMTRRQMDYITYRWIEHSLEHWKADQRTANEWVGKGHCGAHSMLESSSPIYLNDHYGDPEFSNSYDGWNKELGKFVSGHLGQRNNKEFSNSFYAVAGRSIVDLKNQITADKTAIAQMNDAEIDLLDGNISKGMSPLTNRMFVAATEVLKANSVWTPGVTYSYCVDMAANPRIAYFRPLQNSLGDEYMFLRWSDDPSDGTFDTDPEEQDDYVKDEFGRRGVDLWFYRAEGQKTGVRRRYRTVVDRIPLHATWSWWAWHCGGHNLDGSPIKIYRATEFRECNHVFRRCWCESSSRQFGYSSQRFWDGVPKPPEVRVSVVPIYASISYADTVYDERYYEGQAADPLILTSNYFGSDGCITVGASKDNTNPWTALVKTIHFGILSAFDPFCKKTVVFSSAKAGYRKYGEGKDFGRGYRVDWADEGDWNLYTSEWDAVLIPVRMAKTMASGGVWGSADHGFLDDLVQELGVQDDEMRAGGDDVPDTSVLDELFEEDGRLSSRRWYASRAKSGSHKRGLIQARWRVGRKGRTPDWDSLTDRMFH